MQAREMAELSGSYFVPIGDPEPWGPIRARAAAVVLARKAQGEDGPVFRVQLPGSDRAPNRARFYAPVLDGEVAEGRACVCCGAEFKDRLTLVLAGRFREREVFECSRCWVNGI